LTLILGQQDRYAPRANAMLTMIASMRIPAEMLLTEGGLPKLASWRFIPRHSTNLTEPTDFLAYATTQIYRDREPTRAKLCMPIVGNNEAMIIGKILSRHEVRFTIQFVQTMSRAEAELAPDLKPKSEDQFMQFVNLLQDTVFGKPS
jgi:hypothetical protein